MIFHTCLQSRQPPFLNLNVNRLFPEHSTLFCLQNIYAFKPSVKQCLTHNTFALEMCLPKKKKKVSSAFPKVFCPYSDRFLLFPEIMTRGDSYSGKHTHSSHQPEMCRQALDYWEMISQRRQEALQEIYVREVCVWTSVFLRVCVFVCMHTCFLYPHRPWWKTTWKTSCMSALCLPSERVQCPQKHTEAVCPRSDFEKGDRDQRES